MSVPVSRFAKAAKELKKMNNQARGNRLNASRLLKREIEQKNFSPQVTPPTSPARRNERVNLEK